MIFSLKPKPTSNTSNSPKVSQNQKLQHSQPLSKRWTPVLSYRKPNFTDLTHRSHSLSPSMTHLPLPLPFHPAFVAFLNHHRQTLWCHWAFYIATSSVHLRRLDFFVVCFFLAWHITAKANKKMSPVLDFIYFQTKEAQGGQNKDV